MTKKRLTMGANVRVGSFAPDSVALPASSCPLRLESDRITGVSEVTQCANFGLMYCSNRVLFDHLAGAGEQ
jgi:hypothetical protein